MHSYGCLNETSGRIMANVVIGKHSADEIGRFHLVLCKALDATNLSTIARTVHEVVRVV